MSVEYPLTKAHRIRLAQAYRHVPRVDLSIDCVLEAQMGRAFVDDPDCPRAFQIQLGPFVYFAGDPGCPGGREMIAALAPYTLLMPSASGWFEAAVERYGERLGVHDRYSFSPDRLSPEYLRRLCAGSPWNNRLRRMDLDFVTSLWGQDHFIELSDFDSAEDFISRSVGFYLADSSGILGAAYGSLACSKGIEVSIYIVPERRRQGAATFLAANLLMWCLENNLDPHWDAANPESCKLALKLGYRPSGSYEAFRLMPPEN